MTKKKKTVVAPKEIQATRWIVTVTNPPPDLITVGDRKIHERQFVLLPHEQPWLDALKKAGLTYSIRRA